jgi:hypothetical protein
MSTAYWNAVFALSGKLLYFTMKVVLFEEADFNLTGGAINDLCILGEA